MIRRYDPQPGPAECEAMAYVAFRAIPEPFSGYLSGITVRIEDFADNKTLDALGIENEWNLSGLYHGSPLDKQSVWSSGDLPPIITLYRMPLLREWHETGVKLEELVRHIVIHEVGHHFGLSDEEMAALERQAG
jgi:predicted Zn-dependent protease with MMP-like domain